MIVTVRQVAEIFGKAFIQVSSMSTAVNGFKNCGIWPFDPTVFTETEFAPSLTKDIPQPEQLPVTEAQITVSTAPNNEMTTETLMPVSSTTLTSTTTASVSNIEIPATNVTSSTSEALCVFPSSPMESQTESVNVLGVTRDPAISPILSTPEPGCSTSFNIPEIDRRSCTPRESIFTVFSPQQIISGNMKNSKSNEKEGENRYYYRITLQKRVRRNN
jgi:hypothetical protein